MTIIQATASDVLCSGHGAIQLDLGETEVPKGINFIVLAPPAGSVANSLASKLESGAKIEALEIVSPITQEKTPTEPIIYEEGQKVPNYLLYPIDGDWLKPGVAHIIGVSEATTLGDLWPRINSFVSGDKTINCFWAACTALKDAKNQVVVEA